MKRNAINEWKRALSHTSTPQRLAWAQVFGAQRLTASRFEPTVPTMERNLRATRELRARNIATQYDDLGRAILILQRNNRLLRARFGLEWPGAASVVAGEAARRNMSVAALARVLTAGLRRDERRGGSGVR